MFVILRAGLDYNEEVCRSKMVGEWSSRIGYEMGSSPTGVYIATSQTSSGELQAWMKKMLGGVNVLKT